jgi:S-adenosylmethionine decarboxylase
VSSALSAFGNHVLADFYDVTNAILADVDALETLLRASAQSAGAHVLSSHFHSFGAGAGVTGVVLLAESHISIHTWPESRFAAADIFMCGDADPGRALAVLLNTFMPERHHVETVARGLGEF